jgi:hypothetical protein
VSSQPVVSPQQAPDLGPSGLESVSGQPFVLSNSDLIALQAYENYMAQLPVTDQEFRKALNIDSSVNTSDFAQLLTDYGAAQGHAQAWQTTIFPSIVSLANDIYNYNQNVPTYYGALNDLIPKLLQTPPDSTAQQEFAGILQQLQVQANGYSTNAGNVATAITGAATNIQSDQTAIQNDYAHYNAEYGADGTVFSSLQTQIATWTDTYKEANAAYNHDVIVAATTPSYAWVGFPFCPVGLIAAGVVAGIYGARATAAKHEMEAAQAQVNSLEVQEKAEQNVMFLLNAVMTNVQTTLTEIQTALGIVQGIQGAWDAIASDLGNLASAITTNIQQAIPILKQLGIENTITRWANIAGEANVYRVNAYITVQGSQSNS